MGLPNCKAIGPTSSRLSWVDVYVLTRLNAPLPTNWSWTTLSKMAWLSKRTSEKKWKSLKKKLMRNQLNQQSKRIKSFWWETEVRRRGSLEGSVRLTSRKAGIVESQAWSRAHTYRRAGAKRRGRKVTVELIPEESGHAGNEGYGNQGETEGDSAQDGGRQGGKHREISGLVVGYGRGWSRETEGGGRTWR